MKATMKTRAPVIRKLPMGENLIISEGGKKAGKKERRGIQYPKFPFTPPTGTESADSESQRCCHFCRTLERWNASLWLRR